MLLHRPDLLPQGVHRGLPAIGHHRRPGGLEPLHPPQGDGQGELPPLGVEMGLERGEPGLLLRVVGGQPLKLARLAVTEERLRIARDLHDLLGHSLSLIALKAELAGKVVRRDPDRAAAEIDDIENVTRRALAEVRAAVRGYRRLALDEALEGARVALSAAGIECRLAESPLAVSPEVEAVLAWAVREGTTNVVRHSHADHCDIRVEATAGTRAIVVPPAPSPLFEKEA